MAVQCTLACFDSISEKRSIAPQEIHDSCKCLNAIDVSTQRQKETGIS